MYVNDVLHFVDVCCRTSSSWWWEDLQLVYVPMRTPMPYVLCIFPRHLTAQLIILVVVVIVQLVLLVRNFTGFMEISPCTKSDRNMKHYIHLMNGGELYILYWFSTVYFNSMKFSSWIILHIDTCLDILQLLNTLLLQFIFCPSIYCTSYFWKLQLKCLKADNFHLLVI